MAKDFFYLMTFNSTVDIMTRCTFNEVKFFFTFNIDFMV